MKTNFLTPLRVIAVFAIITMLWSCAKENVSKPASNTSAQQSALLNDEALQAGEALVANIVPGTYAVLRFIDTGDDHTSEFNGYTFDFLADGTLVAHTNTGATFTGTWKLNTTQTKMSISISGTKALKDLDDDSWQVVKITNQRISLKKPGPDKVVFVIQ